MPRLLAGLAAALLPAAAVADFAYPTLTPAQKALHAEYVVLGKIAEAEKEPVSAAGYPNAEPAVEYKVVTLKIADRLLGAGGVTQVRVGFAPMNLGARRGRLALQGLKTDVGTEGCFFLVPHPSGDFYVPVPWATPLYPTDKDYEAHLAEVKKVAGVLTDPVTALKAKDAADRFFAVRTLLSRYGSAPPAVGKAGVKREEVPADESKLILGALADMPWLHFTGQGRSNVWNLLPLTEADGWRVPQAVAGEDSNKVMDDLSKKWLEKNRDTYRVKRYVRAGK